MSRKVARLYQSGNRKSTQHMKRALVAAAAVAVSVFANSANANPITYAVSAEGTFNGDIFTGQPAGTDFFSGTFTVDCVGGGGADCVGGTEEVLAANIIVTGGGPINGNYGLGIFPNVATANPWTVTVINDAESRDAVHFMFANSLNLAKLDPIISIELSSTAASFVYIETVVPTADSVATPVSATPLPAALPLLATGLGGLGLLGWRSKRKAQVVAA